ncbi:MoaD/ThiS family protein [Methanolobus psychrotolerans]|uniref:MoaD/ThiS family protein n=1 Tax=Methanolobus psychrotolerans TaxID=1874706 RepID=UPI000B91B529|nr:MoaD/ThiS family protein [Methanolobus psychrotolerans]
MKVKLPSGKTEEMNLGSLTVEELLRILDIIQGEVLVSRDGNIIPEDTVLNTDDNVRIMQVVFGG